MASFDRYPSCMHNIAMQGSEREGFSGVEQSFSRLACQSMGMHGRRYLCEDFAILAGRRLVGRSTRQLEGLSAGMTICDPAALPRRDVSCHWRLIGVPAFQQAPVFPTLCQPRQEQSPRNLHVTCQGKETTHVVMILNRTAPAMNTTACLNHTSRGRGTANLCSLPQECRDVGGGETHCE